ncbi:YoaK family protein [Gordonia sp. ABSL11-1]|uniref:YoaK family protein n=1 Tax=Gordonia sp. ABSL11-1 TaxID=3053924 RepID=UPI002572923E|nr:YoaK family protein [Gordonia sp. ABSL11-1]MDL9944866.1 YoaK family protein [Gordonia sp. ABSL11-1]
MLNRLRAIPEERMHLTLMLVLTFTTGINDAVGYLGLDKVFTGNMTGNVVVLGMAVAGGSELPVLGPALALAGFMAGAAIGGRVLRRSGRRWTPGTTILFATVATIMAALATSLFLAGQHPAGPLMVTITTIAASAMGLQAAAARVVAVKDVTTVVVTSTITGLAADSALGSGRGTGTGRRIAAVVAIIVGAGVGAGVMHLHMAAALLIAAILIAGVTVIGAVHDSGSTVRSSSMASTVPGDGPAAARQRRS